MDQRSDYSRHLDQPLFRNLLMMFAVTLGTAGAWVLMTEVARPSRIPLPIAEDVAPIDQRPQAALAAKLGMVRGDLWAELFFLYSDPITSETRRDFGATTTLDEAVPAAHRALAYAPFRSEVWLLLAEMAQKYQLQNPTSSSALAMSYYTAPNNLALAPLRLSVAARGNGLSDTEVQDLVEQELRTILAAKPELRPAIRSAYATASAPNKRFFERVVQQADPGFTASLKQMK